jgi:cell division protein FtsB
MKYINAILIVLLVLLQYRLWYGTGGLPELWALEEVKKSKIQDTNELQERNQALVAEVVDLKEGLDAIEERARDEMGMIKTDETFFQIIDNASLNTNNK